MKNKQHHGAKIEVTKNGPYLVNGGVPLAEQWIETNAAGESLDYREGKTYPTSQQYALCRCGQSGNKPFCAGLTKRSPSTAPKQPTAHPTSTGRRPSRGLRCSSPTLRICARLQGSVTRRARCGTLSNKPIFPKLENSPSTKPGIVPLGGWSCGIEQRVKPSNPSSNRPLA